MSKPEELEPLYAVPKEAKPSGLPLAARMAIAAVVLGILFWIVWRQAH